MPHRRLTWLVAGFLAAACAALAILQYRWISEFSAAERVRLQEDLRNRLSLVSRAFNDEISTAIGVLTPAAEEIEREGRDRAYAQRFALWRRSHPGAAGSVVRNVALAVPDFEGVGLRILNRSGEFAGAVWPAGWIETRQRLQAHLDGIPAQPGESRSPERIEIPRFEDGREGEWLIVDLDADFIRASLLPALERKYLGADFDAEVTLDSDPSTVIYRSGEREIAAEADASAGMLDVQPRGGPPGPLFSPPQPPPGPRPPPPQNHAIWRLYARHRAGSLEELAVRNKRQNTAASSALLLLILAAALLLMRVSRQAARLADLQMNFVAGVSHELRTPLTVIRTAAFNLRGKLASRPGQVEKYASLIGRESEKLAALVEQVLQFAASGAGTILRERRPAEIAGVIDAALESARNTIEENNVTVEKRIDPALPGAAIDAAAMRQALGNLVENALKYGTTMEDWIGISAAAADGCIEIRVADRGVGIPPEEQHRVFDPFYRGRRALSEQIHGTGLGLSLVKRIVEAHGGSVRVNSGAQGTEFILRIPAMAPDQQHEFAHSAG